MMSSAKTRHQTTDMEWNVTTELVRLGFRPWHALTSGTVGCQHWGYPVIPSELLLYATRLLLVVDLHNGNPLKMAAFRHWAHLSLRPLQDPPLQW